MRGESFLEESLAGFSGYLAVDELYDGPFCVLFIVDNHSYRRLAYAVLEHDPTKDDVRSFLARFKTTLDQLGLAVKGVTTDGSPLYPEALGSLFPGARHQVCQFHVLKEILRAVLHSLAKVRRQLARQIPQLTRGRPSRQKRALARKAQRVRQRLGALFEHRHLFVRRELRDTQRELLRQLGRGCPELQTLRAIVEQVYALFDRRCRTHTALRKLAQLRTKARRFKKLRRALRKLWSPNLEKALTFLDDRLLPATSNAVERANRRHRKMQKTIYRVRTQAHVSARIAMDMLRDAQGAARSQTLFALHAARRAPPTSRPRRRAALATVSAATCLSPKHRKAG